LKKAIIHSKTGYGGYYLRWLEDGWSSKKDTDKEKMTSSRVWYTNQLYVKI
jgi:hypothetical protein